MLPSIYLYMSSYLSIYISIYIEFMHIIWIAPEAPALNPKLHHHTMPPKNSSKIHRRSCAHPDNCEIGWCKWEGEWKCVFGRDWISKVNVSQCFVFGHTHACSHVVYMYTCAHRYVCMHVCTGMLIHPRTWSLCLRWEHEALTCEENTKP